MNEELDDLDEFYDIVNNGPKTLQERIQDILHQGKDQKAPMLPILIPMIRRLLPQVMAAELCATQPMSGAGAPINPLPKRLQYG